MQSTLVLGIGNVIMGDDGAGVHVVQRLQKKYRFPPQVTILDGGTLGLDLLPRLEGVERLLLIDALEAGETPGSLKRLANHEIPLGLKTKLSPHQMGLQDLLAVAELIGIAPLEIVLWGIQPADISIGTSLSLPVETQLQHLETQVLAELNRWGIEPHQL